MYENEATPKAGQCGSGGGCGCKHKQAQATEAVVEAAAGPVVEAATAVAESTAAGPRCGCGEHAASELEPTPGCGCQKLLWIRKTHSVAGALFGLFLVEHLLATTLGNAPAGFGAYMQWLNSVLSAAPWLEWLLYVPLAVAIAFGGYLLWLAGLRYQVKKCKRGGKLRYWLQRVSAVVLLVFVAVHLFSVRNYHIPAGQGEASGEIYVASVQQFQAGWPSGGARISAVALLLVGTLAAIYHLANGAWSAAVAWHIVETPAAQSRLGHLCLAGGLVLGLLGILGWHAFALTPPGG